MPYGLIQSVAPPVEPVSLIEAKLHVRAEADEDNAYLDALIVAAREHVESYCERALVKQTLTLTLDGFPAVIRPPKPRLIAVASIAYVASDGSTQTLAADQYQVDAASEPGRIVPAYGMSWPGTRRQPAAVTITYTAGYGATAGSVPRAIRQAMLLLIGHWYEHREEVSSLTMKEVPMAAKALLAPYRIMEVV